MTIKTYPARPVNGGPLDKARPKRGRWIYEPKVNGWRAMVHTPTGEMFNRHGQRLSIEREFKPVLDSIVKGSTTMPEWLDVEAMERRHDAGRGSLIVLDAIVPGTWEERQKVIWDAISPLECFEAYMYLQFHPPENKLLHFSYTFEDGKDKDMLPMVLWNKLAEINRVSGQTLFEGVVAKRADSIYPMQLRSPDEHFAFWMKHRWQF